MKDIVIFDLDGTLALIDHRRKFIDGAGKKNWNRFFEECDKDEPNIPVIKMNNLLYNAGYEIIILSGRSISVKNKTLNWLKKYNVKYHDLKMRPVRDYTPDEKLKSDWLKKMDYDRIFCVFDDRNKVVDMWRENGLTCFQVAKGDF